MYEISYPRAAEKYLKKIKDHGLKKAFKSAIDKLSTSNLKQ